MLWLALLFTSLFKVTSGQACYSGVSDNIPRVILSSFTPTAMDNAAECRSACLSSTPCKACKLTASGKCVLLGVPLSSQGAVATCSSQEVWVRANDGSCISFFFEQPVAIEQDYTGDSCVPEADRRAAALILNQQQPCPTTSASFPNSSYISIEHFDGTHEILANKNDIILQWNTQLGMYVYYYNTQPSKLVNFKAAMCVQNTITDSPTCPCASFTEKCAAPVSSCIPYNTALDGQPACPSSPNYGCKHWFLDCKGNGYAIQMSAGACHT